MTFEQFFQIVALGACGIVVAMLGWTVREVLSQKGESTLLKQRVDDHSAKHTVYEAERTIATAAMSDLKQNMAILATRSEATQEALKRIEQAVVPRPAPRARKL